MLRSISLVGAVALGFAAIGNAAAQPYPAQPYPPPSGPYSSAPYEEDAYPNVGRALPAESAPYGRPRVPSAQQDYYYQQRPQGPYAARSQSGYGERQPAPYGGPQDGYPGEPQQSAHGGRPQSDPGRPAFDLRPPQELGGSRSGGPAVAALPQDEPPAAMSRREIDPRFKKQMVNYPTREPAGTIIVDTANTYLYLVMGDGRAIRYGIGVGREGFTWAGNERISRMAEWPDWHPPTEMIERQPFLPRFMAGGPGNPMGARALYLGKTIYRIHGTNEPHTIGKFVSSGCIRMLNEDVEDLYQRVSVGHRVVVLPGRPPVRAEGVR
jgi:lipoprotein-anchoring transpeptidase ErfK/SrfK